MQEPDHTPTPSERPADLNDFRKDGLHLPEFMRDFHDQKRLFKYLGLSALRQDAKAWHPSNHHPRWDRAHVYTVDIFLWIMAAYGYTLQPAPWATEADLVRLPEALKVFQGAWDDAAHDVLMGKSETGDIMRELLARYS